jgi:DNA-binding response OmpR family regulator
MYKILLIDDDELVRNTLRMMLAGAGHEVSTAPNGANIEADIARTAPDFVITDMLMPGTDGIETIQRIRKINPTVLVIAISGGGRANNMDVLRFSKSFGADAVLAKPFLPRVLLDLVARLGAKA